MRVPATWVDAHVPRSDVLAHLAQMKPILFGSDAVKTMGIIEVSIEVSIVLISMHRFV